MNMSDHRRHRYATWVAGFLASALALAACGSPGGNEAEPTDQGSSTAASETGSATETGSASEATSGGGGEAASGDTIKIGVLAPTTGNVAASGQDMLDGWNLYWKLNGNTVAGHTIETFHEDSAGDPSTGLNKAEKLVGNVGVDMIVGPLLANVGLAVADAMSREGVPTFFPIVSADDLTQRQRLDNVVRVAGWTSSQTTHPLGQYAIDQGYKTAVTLCSDYAFGHETCGGFVNTFTDGGGKILNELWNPLGTQDFSTYVAQIKSANPDVVFVEQVGGDSVRFVKAYSDFGLKDSIPLFGGETLLDQSLLRNMGDEALDLVSTGHYAGGRESQDTQDFVKEYDKAYGKLPSYYSVAMYTAARWIAKAIEDAGGDVSNKDALLKAVRAVEFQDTPMGALKLDEYDNPIENVYIRKVAKRDDGRMWNVVTKTYDNVSQFWNYDPKEFLAHPVYSRDYQGNGVWPEPQQ